MRKTTDSFSFELPSDWVSFREGTRLVAQGAAGEELMLSSWFAGAPPTASNEEVERLVNMLLDNATRAAQESAEHPDLQITKPFSRDVDAGGFFPCWTILSETRVRDTFFGQAIIRGQRAVMLATFEAPLSPTRATELQAFLETFAPGA
jgi:hypothetical protein